MATRRDFLKETGGLLIGFSLAEDLLVAGTVTAPSPALLNSWLRVGNDGAIQVLTGKVDIGMGVGTALRQIVAEELDVALDRIQFVMGDTSETPDQGGVGGSTSISAGARPLRNAAASARYQLLQTASTKLAVPVEQLSVRDGIVSVTADPARTISYGALAEATGTPDPLKVSGSGFGLNVEGKGKPKDPTSYTVVGQPVHRSDLKLKIMGQATYAPDFRVPGMLHGRVVRPASTGARLQSIDETAARKIPGYVKAVTKGNFVGVVAETEWAAIRAASELKVNWSEPAHLLPSDLYAHMRTVVPHSTRPGIARGDAPAILQTSQRKLEASYEWPFQAHSTMGPGCAVADFQAGGITTIWCGAQKPHSLQKGLAGLLKVPENQVRIVWLEDAGSYGRAGYEDVAADAALLSQDVARPVRVQWMRNDMTAWGGKGPATTFELAAALDAKGTLTAVSFTARAFSGADILPQPSDAGNTLAGQLIGIPNKPADEVTQWGDTTEPYVIANIKSICHVLPPLHGNESPLRATHLRDPGGPAATFASESFMDELASSAGADPVVFRMNHLQDVRARAVLTAVVGRVKWETRTSPHKRVGTADIVTGRGVALGLRGGTHVAVVADVEVNRRTGAVQVKRLTCAHDCGLIVNPDGLRGTISANLIQSMSRVMKEEITFDRDNVTSRDWLGYRVAVAADIPEIDIVLINRPELPPGGAGEPSTRPVPAAINNAIFDAIGIRLRQAPLTSAKVKAAIDLATA